MSWPPGGEVVSNHGRRGGEGKGKGVQTHRLDLVGRHCVVALQSCRHIEDFATVEEAVTRRNHTSAGELISGQEVELRLGNGLSQNLFSNTRLRHALQSLDSLQGTLTDRHRRASDLNSEETSVAVGQVLGNDLSAGGSSRSLCEETEARSPFDAGLTAEESGQDSNVGFVGGQVVAWEGDDHGVSTRQRGSLLTTIVLRGLGEERKGALGGGILNVPEEGLDPLAQAGLCSSVGNNRNVRLSVNTLGK